MFTTGSRWFFGLAGAALVAAWVYGGATNPDEVGLETFTGVLSFGYKGGVGDQLGYAILVAVSGVAVFIGATLAAFRDASPEAGAQLLGVEAVPAIVSPEEGSYWPVIGAFGLATVAVGLVTTAFLVLVGLVVLAAVTFEWAITAWADRATGDPEVNRSIRRRVMMPIEVPVLGALGIALLVASMSRILLAAPELAVYLIFGLVPVVVLLVVTLLATRPSLNRSVIAVLCVLGALAVLAGGIVSMAVGPREIEEHEPEGEEHEGTPVLSLDSPIVVDGSHR